MRDETQQARWVTLREGEALRAGFAYANASLNPTIAENGEGIVQQTEFLDPALVCDRPNSRYSETK